MCCSKPIIEYVGLAYIQTNNFRNSSAELTTLCISWHFLKIWVFLNCSFIQFDLISSCIIVNQQNVFLELRHDVGFFNTKSELEI